jgi:hypothetical protein
MRSMLLAGSLATLLALPGLASAQTRCQRDQQTNQVAGTVVGAGIGALLGSAVAGHHDSTAGAVIGGLAGGVAGNQIAKNAGQPCPSGYYEVPATAPPPVAVAPPAPFWSRAPAGVRERIDYLEARIRSGERDRVLSRDEADRAYRDLADLRRQERRLRRRDGGALTSADRDFLQARLDEVGRRVRWAERSDAYAYSSPTGANAGAYDSNRGYRDSNRGDYDAQGYWHAR